MGCARLGWLLGPSTNSFKLAADIALNTDDTDHSDGAFFSLSFIDESDVSSTPTTSHDNQREQIRKAYQSHSYSKLLGSWKLHESSIGCLPIPSRSQNSSRARTKCLLKDFAVDEDEEVGGGFLFLEEACFASTAAASTTNKS